ncbi:MAG: helix-turn-helix domain-containing protein [Planctomycetota bacterium]
MRDDVRDTTEEELARSLPRSVRRRLMRGEIREGAEIRAFRRFTWLTQEEFARALGISVHTLRNWEQGRRRPEGPALALLRIAARHPKVLRENLATSD